MTEKPIKDSEQSITYDKKLSAICSRDFSGGIFPDPVGKLAVGLAGADFFKSFYSSYRT